MADGHQALSLSPTSPLEEGEIVPQRVSISEMATGQSYSQQGHPLPKLNNQSQKHSYASILQAQEHNSSAVSIAQGNNQSQPSSESLTMVKNRDPTTAILKPITQHQGKPAVHFLDSEKEALVEKLNLVLIGKFTHGRPSLLNIKIFFQKFKLQGVVNVSPADSKHIYIECSNLSDYYWIWLHLSMNIHGFAMRLFKWGADFSPRIESPIAPVWIRIVGMPLYLFDELSLWQIASAVGKPIRIDSRNLNRSILSFARVCVELDISQQLTDTIWVCIKKENTDNIVERICLQVFYDVLPLYCTTCSHIGHGEEMCKRKMAKGSATVNVEPTVSVVATTGNRFGSINLLGGETSKALGVDLVANEPPTKPAAANGNEDKAAQTLQNNPTAKQIAKQIECKANLEKSAVHVWQLVTGKKNNRNNKVQPALSASLNNQDLQQSNQKSHTNEVVDVSTDQITLDVKGQSTCCLTDATLEKRDAVKRETQQGNAQSKGYIQQKQIITDLTKANQEHSLNPSCPLSLVDQMEKVDIEANTDSQPAKTIQSGQIAELKKPEVVELKEATEQHSKTPDPTVQDTLLITGVLEQPECRHSAEDPTDHSGQNGEQTQAVSVEHMLHNDDKSRECITTASVAQDQNSPYESGCSKADKGLQSVVTDNIAQPGRLAQQKNTSATSINKSGPVGTTAASVIETVQALQIGTAADQNASNIENGHSQQSLIDMEQNFSRSTGTTVALKSTAEAEFQQESVQNKRHNHQRHSHSSGSSHSWVDQMEKIDMKENTVMQAESSTSLANHKLQQLEVQNRFDVLLLEDSDAPFSRWEGLVGEHVDTAAADQDNKAIVLAVLPVDEGQAFQAAETGTHQGQEEVPAVVVQEKEIPIYHTSSSTWADQAETEDDIVDEQEREPQYNGLAFKLQEGDKDIHTAEKVRYIDFEKIDVFDDIIAPRKPGSVPSSPRFSKRAPALDDLALIHSKDEWNSHQFTK